MFQTTSQLVLLDVQVSHKTTHASNAALRQDDLEVFEEGKPQTITFFSRDELPLSIVMLFDMTSTSKAVLKGLADGG